MYVIEVYRDSQSRQNKQASRTRAFSMFAPPEGNELALIHAARGRRSMMMIDSLQRKWERQCKCVDSPFTSVEAAYSQVVEWGHIGEDILEKNLSLDEIVGNGEPRQGEEDILLRGNGADVFIRQVCSEWVKKWENDQKMDINQRRYFFVIVFDVGSYILDCEEGMAIHSNYYTVSSDWRDTRC